MKTIAIEDIMADTVISLFENAAELGCPNGSDIDMWFRCLSNEEQNKVMSDLIDIQEREEEMKKEMEGKDIIMKEIVLDLEEDVVGGIVELARSKVVNDRKALINYGVNYILKEIVNSNGQCLS